MTLFGPGRQGGSLASLQDSLTAFSTESAFVSFNKYPYPVAAEINWGDGVDRDTESAAATGFLSTGSTFSRVNQSGLDLPWRGGAGVRCGADKMEHCFVISRSHRQTDKPLLFTGRKPNLKRSQQYRLQTNIFS